MTEKNKNGIEVELLRPPKKNKAYLFFVCLFTFIIAYLHIYTFDRRGEPRVPGQLYMQLRDISYGLKEYYNIHGRYPTNDEGLLVLEEIWGNPVIVNKGNFLGLTPVTPLTKERRYYGYDIVYSDAGLQSPWFIPYVYENRNGLDPNLFEDSVAYDGASESYCVKVDEKVYVYSLGAKKSYDARVSYMREKYITLGIFYLLLIISIVAMGRFMIKNKHRQSNYIGSLLAMVGTVLITFFPSTMVSCYLMSGPFSGNRNSKYYKEYRKLIKKYRDKGIIKTETYDKITKALDEEDKFLHGRY